MPVVGFMPYLSSAPASTSGVWRLLVPPQGGFSWWKVAIGGGSGKSSSNKLGLAGSLVRAGVVLLLSAAGQRGDGWQRWWWPPLSTHAREHGSRAVSAGSPGSFLSAGLSWMPCAVLLLLNLQVVRRLLPPRSTAAACRRVKSNLLVLMPCWRPSCSSAVCSRRSTPSGSVPGGAVVDCASMRAKIGGAGARRRPGLDCFFLFCSKVLDVIVRDPVVILFSFLVLLVLCTPPTAG